MKRNKRDGYGKKRVGGGIKAVISLGDLNAVLDAAKKYQVRRSEEGFDTSKLLHHIANAEAVVVKYRRRSETKYRLRVKAREAAQGAEMPQIEDSVAWNPPVVDAPSSAQYEYGRSKVWDKIKGLIK